MTLRRESRFRLSPLPRDEEVGWTPYAWLIYLIPVLLYPLALRQPWPQQAVTWAAVLVFLVLYFYGFWVSGIRKLRSVVGIAILAMALAPFNHLGLTLFIFAAAFLGDALSMRRAWSGIIVIEMLTIATTFLVRARPEAWIPAVIFVAIIGGINIHYGELRRRNVQLRLDQEEIASLAKLEERERIARDLHDLLGQTLSVITVKAQLAQRLAAAADNPTAGASTAVTPGVQTTPSSTNPSARLGRELVDIEQISRHALQEVRRAVLGYRVLRLGTELTKTRVALESAGIELMLETCPFDLSPDIETVVGLALREASTNVVRHSRATRCWVSFRHEAQAFSLTVRDNGRGYRGAHEASGLRGMRERVAQIGGMLELGDRLRGGARLVLTVAKSAPPYGETDSAHAEPTVVAREAGA